MKSVPQNLLCLEPNSAQPPDREDEEDPDEGSWAAMLQAAQGDRACECRHRHGSPIGSRCTTGHERLISASPAHNVGVRRRTDPRTRWSPRTRDQDCRRQSPLGPRGLSAARCSHCTTPRPGDGLRLTGMDPDAQSCCKISRALGHPSLSRIVYLSH